MKNIVKEILNQIRADKVRRRRSRAVLLVLSLFVASGVLWQLKITGITMTGEALCGNLEHQHTAECLGMKLVCGKEETAGHRHEDACYQQLVCEDAEHNHEDQCYVTAEQPVCGLEEADSHIHDDSCKKEGYVCGYETEHVHDLLCYSDLEADLETSSDWEKTIPALSRESAEDLAMVARTQIGYAESARNYKVGEDGSTKQGYTRYGEWYGNPYGDWNAMFVSFCLRYAEHPAYETLKNSGVETMRVAAEQAGVYQAAAGTTPYVGDLAFLDKDSNGNCDTVAVVTERQEGSMTLVEGDCGGVVAENQYSLDNGTILGYALLTAQPATLEENAEEEIVEVDDVIANEAKNGDVVPAADGNITISFVINDINYTDDNELTHVIANLTENNPSVDGYVTNGGLSYTYWRTESGKYKHQVTGKGTLMTFTIPAGTTLSGSGYSLPSISITNITGSTFSYGSSYSWVTNTGMICNDKTEFTEDTTLSLCLYETGTTCGLNWVCNCDNGGSHSITYYISGFASPTFTWGQSVSAPYIPTAEAVNSMYTGSQYCTAGPDHGMQFKGWYVKNAEGEEIDFAAGVPILQNYVDTNSSGYSVKVYARWEKVAAPVTVTATFVNGETQTTKTLNSGDALGDKLPAVTPPDGQIFLGWKIGDTEDYATAETVIEADTIYTAVFAKKVTVSFVNGETTVETRELAENAVLGALPQAPEAAENQVFLGWQAEGVEGYATAETVITTDTTFHAAFATNVTVTFMNGQTQYGDVVKVPQGALVWEYLPETEPEYTGTSETPMTFAGWGWKTVDNEVHMVTEETVVEADMVLYAVFEEVMGYEIYLHDMAPDGKTDYETEGLDIQISQTALPEGQTLAQALAEDPYRMIHDDALASECIWYIKQADGTYAVYDLTTEVTSDLHLYTFNYSVTLTREEATATASFLDLFAVASAVEVNVSDDGNTLTLTLREGEKPTAADFVVNGVDYTLYTWTYTDSNDVEQTLNISDIIANGVTENITATSSATDLAITANTNTQHIYFYVIVDQEKKLVQETNLTVYSFGNSDAKGRWRISEASLESIYSEYNLDVTAADQYKFAFCSGTNSDADIWNDVPLYEANGMQFVGLETSIVDNVYFYYLPNVKETTSTWDNRTQWDDYKTSDTFYTVEVLDPNGKLYAADELPPVEYVLTGDSHTITLLYDPEVPWMLNNASAANGVVDEANGTITFTFDSVTEPLRFVAGTGYTFDIDYNINLLGTPTSTAPTINGQSTFTDVITLSDNETYLVHTPSKLLYSTSGSGALRTVKFLGWVVNGDENNILSAGTKLNSSQLLAYGSSISLQAKWDQLHLTHTVSFYVNLELQVEGTPQTDASNYTSALYGTELKVSPCPVCDENQGTDFTAATIIGGSLDNMVAYNQEIRKLVNGVQAEYMPNGTDATSATRTFTLSSFPDDEILLANIRAKQAEYIKGFEESEYYDENDPDNVDAYRAVMNPNNANNHLYSIICAEDKDGTLRYIPVDQLTSENYSIQWYVFKYQTDNGWHVDGVLVKKQGWLTVNKTFYGDDTAISKDDFSITVQDADANSAYTLTLSAGNDANTTVPTYVSDNTYTWVIPLTTNKEYTLKENNYKANSMTTLAEYRIDNPATGTTPTDGRVTYTDDGVKVMVKAYNTDIPYTGYQTVNFYNSYIPTSTLNISKVDGYGKPLPGVSFRLLEDDDRMDIWKDSNGVYNVNGFGEPVETGLITVDEHGNAQIAGLMDLYDEATYEKIRFTLRETTAPEGYGQIEDIAFIVKPAYGEYELDHEIDGVKLLGGNVLRVINTSNVLDVVVRKTWIDNANIPVKAKLMLDDAVLGYAEQTLSAENNWTATWENVPAYVGGQLANYSVRETWIGNTAFNGSYADGYNDYLVTVAQPVYTYDENGLPTAASITVTNRTYMGGLSFTKVNEKGVGLQNALFCLYIEECEHMDSGVPCEHVYGDAVRSDLHGNVNFGNLAPGTYYMKEVIAPAGYQENITVYKVTVTGSGTTLTVNGSDTPISIITNIPATASLKVQKVDEGNTPLTGASFKVYMLNEETGEWDTVTRNGQTVYSVDDSGKLTVPDLMPGDYKLVEVSAPAGYYRMTEEIEFNVALAAIVALDVRTDENGNRVEDTTNGWSFDGETITVVNVTGSELPQTGGMGTHYGTMAGLLMMLSSLLYGFLLRRKRERGAV